MKVSDFIADYLARQGITYVFGVTGAHILWLIDSISRHPKLKFIPCAHEQGAAFAADAYSRFDGFGVALATSGPGAVNLLSGACSAYFDFTPMLLLTGQVATQQLGGRGMGIRQLGFQETPTVDIYRPVVKWAFQLLQPERVRLYLEFLLATAKKFPQGPVLLDVPDDVQRAEVDPEALAGCHALAEKPEREVDTAEASQLMAKAERPILILGAGARMPRALLGKFVGEMGFPVLTTWGGKDLLPWNHPLNFGTFGTCGPRTGNFAIQCADLVLSLGAKLGVQEVGQNQALFAPQAKKIVVDADIRELGKLDGLDALRLPMRARAFLEAVSGGWRRKDYPAWRGKLEGWRERYSVETEDWDVSPYRFIRALSQEAPPGCVVVTDAGATLVWMMQSWRVKDKQRVMSAFNHSPMGWALPAAIGAAEASNRPVICVTGDGSFLMNIQELATLSKLNLNVKVFVMDNLGYGIIRQTQDMWLEGRHFASSSEGGLGGIKVAKVASSFGLQSCQIGSNKSLPLLPRILAMPGPVVCQVSVDPRAKILARMAKGKTLADLWPELPPETLGKELSW